MTMPWSFKFLFGLMNDCCPILGYHRKPYMIIGWSFCAATLAYLCWAPLPPPYWCRDAQGWYVTSVERAGEQYAAEPCNADAASSGGSFAIMMMLAALGYVVADVAADGLTVQLARKEPIETRGRTQTQAYLIRTCGQVCASVLIGFVRRSAQPSRRSLSPGAMPKVCYYYALTASGRA